MSDKAELKRLKKQAELALQSSPVPVIGERIPNVYDWGMQVLATMLSIEERLRNVEARLAELEVHVLKHIKSDTVIQATAEQTITSNTVAQITPEQTVNSDSEISS